MDRYELTRSWPALSKVSHLRRGDVPHITVGISASQLGGPRFIYPPVQSFS